MQEDQSRDDAEKAASYDRLLNLLKEKVDKASTSSEKIKLSTIVPVYWSIRARALRIEKGILSAPPKKKVKN